MPIESAIHVGTSGWSYDSWVEPFYPKNISPNKMLPTYADTFTTVELNNSFYKMPSANSIENWVASTPQDFFFAFKANRYVTHMKKLNDPAQGIEYLLETVAPFKDKLGPILFQLPPNWRVNIQRLEAFLVELPKHLRYTFEFRDHSWLCEDVYALLKLNNVALCFYDFKGFHSPEVITTDFIYVRLHGPNITPYVGNYNAHRLREYAQKFIQWARNGKTVYCYFDNDQSGCAPNDAKKLKQIIHEQFNC